MKLLNFCFQFPGTQVMATDHETSKLGTRLLAIYKYTHYEGHIELPVSFKIRQVNC